MRVSESLHVPRWPHTRGPGNPVTRVRWRCTIRRCARRVFCQWVTRKPWRNYGLCSHSHPHESAFIAVPHYATTRYKVQTGSDATPCDGRPWFTPGHGEGRTVLTLGHSAKTGPSSRDNTPYEAKTRQVHRRRSPQSEPTCWFSISKSCTKTPFTAACCA